MKTILFPTDFSKAANSALDYALRLTQKLSAKLVIMNAYAHNVSNSSVMIDLTDLMRKDSEAELKKLQNDLTEKFPNVVIETVAYNGDLIEAVKRCVAKFEAELVVMGTTGASGLKAVFMGSNTTSLIQEINTPILAVPVNTIFDDEYPPKIAIATDLNDVKHPEIYRPVKELASALNGQLILVHVSNDLSEVNPVDFIDHAADFDELFTGMEHTFKFLEGSDYENEILDFIVTENIDLLVVVSKKRTFFGKLFHKSLSKQLAMKSLIPILILSEQ